MLASGSPRRRALLETLHLDFDVEPPDVDETRLPDEAPALYVERVAKAKAGAVARPDRLVIGADTTVVYEGRVMGKPGHPEEARAMLRRLQGETHEVLTGMAVAGFDGEISIHAVVDVAMVEMMPMTEDEIADYVGTGEPMDKAGAYALQGMGGVFVSRVIGSPFTVIGLPIHFLDRLMSAAGAGLSHFRIQDSR